MVRHNAVFGSVRQQQDGRLRLGGLGSERQRLDALHLPVPVRESQRDYGVLGFGAAVRARGPHVPNSGQRIVHRASGSDRGRHSRQLCLRRLLQRQHNRQSYVLAVGMRRAAGRGDVVDHDEPAIPAVQRTLSVFGLRDDARSPRREVGLLEILRTASEGRERRPLERLRRDQSRSLW